MGISYADSDTKTCMSADLNNRNRLRPDSALKNLGWRILRQTCLNTKHFDRRSPYEASGN
jgi:hypothetical protein